MFIIFICCYLSLPKVRCKQMHCGWQWLFKSKAYTCNFGAIFFSWCMWTSGWVMNVQMRVHILRTFITHLLVRIHQKKKVALEIAAKIASACKPAFTVKSLPGSTSYTVSCVLEKNCSKLKYSCNRLYMGWHLKQAWLFNSEPSV
jgi:hypothetical protein